MIQVNRYPSDYLVCYSRLIDFGNCLFCIHYFLSFPSLFRVIGLLRLLFVAFPDISFNLASLRRNGFGIIW